MIEHAVKHARTRGLKLCYVHIHVRNIPSILAYKRAGFHAVRWWRDESDPLLAAGAAVEGVRADVVRSGQIGRWATDPELQQLVGDESTALCDRGGGLGAGNTLSVQRVPSSRGAHYPARAHRAVTCRQRSPRVTS